MLKVVDQETFEPVACEFRSQPLKSNQVVCTLRPTRELEAKRLFALSINDCELYAEQALRFRQTWAAVSQWDEKTLTLPPPLLRIVQAYAAPSAGEPHSVLFKKKPGNFATEAPLAQPVSGGHRFLFRTD